MRLVPPNAAMRVGLLGGSFNPAHEGHMHISMEALRRLGLDEVWWLVTPQNPLKSREEMATLDYRMASAREVAGDTAQLRVTDIEKHLGTTYSCDTIRLLMRHYPNIRFVWLMGADNLHQFHRWYRWQEIFTRIPVAIFDRSPFTYEAITGKAATRFRYHRLGYHQAGALPMMPPPAWIYMHILPHPLSSTQLRQAARK